MNIVAPKGADEKVSSVTNTKLSLVDYSVRKLITLGESEKERKRDSSAFMHALFRKSSSPLRE